jgi:hypothetical protein
MKTWQRIRGLLGTTITWGAVGALVGGVMFFARYQPWRVAPQFWARELQLTVMFLSGGALWGSACGFAFGAVIWATARHRTVAQLSSRQFLRWGAFAGAVFPLVLYTPIVVFRGAFGAVPLFGTLTVISALLGAGVGRVVFSLVKRAPEVSPEPLVLMDASLLSESDVSVSSGEHVR